MIGNYSSCVKLVPASPNEIGSDSLSGSRKNSPWAVCMAAGVGCHITQHAIHMAAE